jgi:hypothetical protein
MPGPVGPQGPSSATVGDTVPHDGGGAIVLLPQWLDTPFGALNVPAAIKGKWDSLTEQTHFAGESVQAYLGWPLRLLKFHGGGTAVFFERGVIVLRPDGGCCVVCGAIYLRYAALGGVQHTGWSPGLPISDEEEATNGRCSRFDNADIYWSPATGAHEIHGAIRDHWQALGAVDGFLGYPLTDQTPVYHATDAAAIGGTNLFEGGSIYWSQDSGAWEIHGDLRRAWLERYGGPGGSLGFPVSDEGSSPSRGLRYNDFQRGCLVSPGSYDGIRMLTAVDVYLDRLAAKGWHTAWERQRRCPIRLYVNASVSTSTAGSTSRRQPFPSGVYGPSASPQLALMTISPVRGSTTIDVTLDGWDAAFQVSSAAQAIHLGTVTDHFDLDRIFNNPGPQESWDGDFFAAYSIRNLTPADPAVPQFRQDLFWSFANFTTETLKDEFFLTFPHNGDDGWGRNPLDALFSDNVYAGLAAGGHCFAMCLEANDALAATSYHSAEPIHSYGTPLEWALNLRQGYQIGTGAIDYVVGTLLAGRTQDPVACFNESRAMWERNDYPVICITGGPVGSSWHAVRPYDWDDSDANHLVIYVANPNEPASTASLDGDPPNTIHIYPRPDPGASSFTFAFAPNDPWSGDGSTGGRMFALPYSVMCEKPHTPYWETPLALIGGSILLMAGDAKTLQLTDDQGRTFYRKRGGVAVLGQAPRPPESWALVNEDAGGRIPGLARIPLYRERARGSRNRDVRRPGSGVAAGRDVGRLEIPPVAAVTVVSAPLPAIPELYRIHGIRPFGVSPAESRAPYAPPLGGAGRGPQAAIAVDLLTRAASTVQPQAATAVELLIDAASIVDSTIDWIKWGDEVHQLKHEVVPGSGAYTWAFRSVGASVAAVVSGRGATTADVLSPDVLLLSKPGNAEQALSITLGTSPDPRSVDLTLVSCCSAGQVEIRVFDLYSVPLQAGAPFSAGLRANGKQIVLVNGGAAMTFHLRIQAGLMMAPGMSVTLQAGEAAIIEPDSWEPELIVTCPVTMSVVDLIDGTVLRQLNLR